MLFLWTAGLSVRGLGMGFRTTHPPPRHHRIATRACGFCHGVMTSIRPTVRQCVSDATNTNQGDRSDPAMLEHEEEDFFLRQVELTTRNVLSAPHSHHLVTKDDILKLPSRDREAVGIARHLETRLQAFRRNNDCPRCWMQRAHCICAQCPPIVVSTAAAAATVTKTQMATTTTTTTSLLSPRPIIRRIFLILHHKEIALKVDTAKLILAAFPQECRLVVGGIGSQYQESMRELEDAVNQNPDRCLVLFPDESARTYEELLEEVEKIGLAGATTDSTTCTTTTSPPDPENGWDLVVLDGTWAQARKFHQRYFPEPSSSTSSQRGPWRVQLSAEAVEELGRQSSATTAETSSDQESPPVLVEGHQLRRHSIAWRQIGTFEATRLFLRDVGLAHRGTTNTTDDNADHPQETLPFWSKIQPYQEIANRAARKELGPPRVVQK
jgi:DTW domain-containing protein YfiP